MQPKLIIHGGAGRAFRGESRARAVEQALSEILATAYAALEAGASAEAAVVQGCQLLEDNPLFNAGTGSVLQADGVIRMSAALMSGETQRFSGVINVCRVRNPILLAEALQHRRDHVLSDSGAGELARELGLPVYDPLVERRLEEWLEERRSRNQVLAADVVPTDESPADENSGTGTIGVVAMDRSGRLAAGTSTGGRGFEHIGRVSDSAMPAGNYASQSAAVSCTGIGEDIVDECLAARLVVRVEDGQSLAVAFERSFRDCMPRRRLLGAIGIDAGGDIVWGKTTDVLLAAYTDGSQQGHTLNLPSGLIVGSLAATDL